MEQSAEGAPLLTAPGFLQDLTTYEILQAVQPAAAEGLEAPPRDGWKRFKFWVYCHVPHGIKGNRLGIQWSVLAAASFVLIFIRAPADEFWAGVWGGLGIFIAINAITTCDMATGATNRNAILRLLGTTLAAAISFSFMIPMVRHGMGGAADHYLVRWINYFACTASPFFWQFWVYHFPSEMHENFTFQGLSTNVYLYVNSSPRIVYDMLICTMGCYIGTVIGWAGNMLVVPLRSRDRLTHEVALICDKLACVLEPLIDFESGSSTVHDRNKKQRRSLSKRSLSKRSLSKRSLSKRALPKPVGFLERASTVLKRTFSRKPPDESEQVVSMTQFKEHVWEILTEVSSLMNTHPESIRNAKREKYWSRPHDFHIREFMAMYDDCTALYFHISSLFLVLQTQLDTTLHKVNQEDLPFAKQWQIHCLAPTVLQPIPSAEFGGLFRAPDEMSDFSSMKGDSQSTERMLSLLSPPGQSVNGDVGVVAPAAPGPAASSFLLPPVPPVSSDMSSIYTPFTALAGKCLDKSSPRGVPLRQSSMLTARAGSLELPEKPQRAATLPALVTEEEEVPPASPAVERNTLLSAIQEVSAKLQQEAPPAPNQPAAALGNLLEVPSPEAKQPFIHVSPSGDSSALVLTPIVKWASTFGPLVAMVAQDLADLLSAIADCLDCMAWDDRTIQDKMESVEISLKKLSQVRREWWHAVEHTSGLMVSDALESTRGPQVDWHRRRRVIKTVSQDFCKPWLGLSLDAYSKLTDVTKDELWCGFENMQDRQAATLQMCVVVTKRLKSFTRHCREYLHAQFPGKQAHSYSPEELGEREVSANIDFGASSGA